MNVNKPRLRDYYSSAAANEFNQIFTILPSFRNIAQVT
jgi:hypothetical protein